MIRFTCRHCGAALFIKPDQAGGVSRCPTCNQVAQVPMATEARESEAITGRAFASRTTAVRLRTVVWLLYLVYVAVVVVLFLSMATVKSGPVLPQGSFLLWAILPWVAMGYVIARALDSMLRW